MKRVKVQDFETGYQYDLQKKQVRKASKTQRIAKQHKHNLWTAKEEV